MNESIYNYFFLEFLFFHLLELNLCIYIHKQILQIDTSLSMENIASAIPVYIYIYNVLKNIKN
jgi:hypothetical protein